MTGPEREANCSAGLNLPAEYSAESVRIRSLWLHSGGALLTDIRLRPHTLGDQLVIQQFYRYGPDLNLQLAGGCAPR